MDYYSRVIVIRTWTDPADALADRLTVFIAPMRQVLIDPPSVELIGASEHSPALPDA